MNSATFDKFIHVGILTDNLEKAIETFEAIGIGPWDEIVQIGGNPGDENFITNGNNWGDEPVCRFSKARNLGCELEVVEPLGDAAPYKAWMEEHGPGLHHLEFYSSKDDFYDVRQKCQDLTGGRELWIDGKIINPEDGSLVNKWAYVDMRPECGAMIEISSTPEG